MNEEITILKNHECNGFEIYPNGKLSDDQIQILQNDGWRWHKYKKCYYALATKKRFELIRTNYPNIRILDDDLSEIEQFNKKMDVAIKSIIDALEIVKKLNKEKSVIALKEFINDLDAIKRATQINELPF